MKYDPKTRTTRNNDGVEIRVPGFGNSTTVELIGNGTLGGSSNLYFHPIAEALVKLGYRRGVDMHGAPFDFRKAANEQAKYFDQVTKLIEDTYTKNGNKSVILLT